jgi:FMN reductase
VFKNAIDYMEFLAKDSRPYFQGRAIGLISVSDSSPMSGMANCVNELRAWLAPTRVTLTANDFSPEMTLTNEIRSRRLTRVVTELLEFKSWSGAPT